MRVGFAGTPDFAAVALEALLDQSTNIVAVWTQPDRPAGRGRKIHQSPVKEVALGNGIPVFQPINFKAQEAIDDMASFNLDVLVVAAYGLILPQSILDLPTFGCLNIHASLLPRWRGAAPIQRAIAAGDTQSGVGIMQMALGLDTGDVLLEKTCAITDQTTGGELHDELAQLGGVAICEAMANLEILQTEAKVQPEEGVTYAHKLTKEEAKIDWHQPVQTIDRLIRAFNPWPVAYANLNGKPLRIHGAMIESEQSVTSAKAGEVLSIGQNGITVNTQAGQLTLKVVQPSGKKAMPVSDFLNGAGRSLEVGVCFE